MTNVITWHNLAEKDCPRNVNLLIRYLQPHPTRGKALPFVGFRSDHDCDDNDQDVRLYATDNHIESLIFGHIDTFNEETNRASAPARDFEWAYIPGYTVDECRI